MTGIIHPLVISIATLWVRLRQRLNPLILGAGSIFQ